METREISPDVHSGPMTMPSDLTAALEELTKLRKKNAELQETLNRERERGQMVQQERDEYRRIIYPPLAAKIDPVELARFTESCQLDADCDLADVMKELEDMDREFRK